MSQCQCGHKNLDDSDNPPCVKTLPSGQCSLSVMDKSLYLNSLGQYHRECMKDELHNIVVGMTRLVFYW